LTLAGEGADVVVNYFSNEEAAMETFERVRAIAKRSTLRKADISSKTEVDAMVSDTFSRFGKIHILVNNAGIVSRDSIQTLKDEEWARVIDVNLNGALNCIRAVSGLMINNRYGKIINIASVAGLVNSSQTDLAYAVSKSALITLTKKLSLQLGPFGINVNAVAPGTILTDMSHTGRTERETEMFIQEKICSTALKRVGQPIDIANAVLFLASDESSFITGQVIVVDGGRTDFFSHT